MKTALAALLLAAAVAAPQAEAHWRPGTAHNMKHAIVAGFCNGKVDLRNPCRYGREALVVARLEGGAYHWIRGTCHRAVNGQYRGCFQMGSWERDTYGHGPGPWQQARAAWRYFVASGYDWSPWACKPWGVCY